nr:cinnamoyl-CoA reductase 1-like [Ipomoea batatas]
MKTVCVTGASGYIASWIVKFLLQRGYIVKATVRYPGLFSSLSLHDPKKTEHLLSLEGAKERLHLFKADLLEEGSFDSVVEGCEGVFHTASPFFHNVTDPQAELIDPAVKGTLNVLGSCAKTPSVQKVVVTSSIAAVAYNGKPRTPEVVVDETWWSGADFCKEMKVYLLLRIF